jgi:DNA polymerase-3 subunit epsilon
MFATWSLRFRIFLFFGLLGVGALALGAAGAYLGMTRIASGADPQSALITAALVSSLLMAGLIAGVWLLFDENVAKPIIALSNALRVQAHAADVNGLKAADAKYLGDLAPAASAVIDGFAHTRLSLNSVVAKHTEQLTRDNARLARLVRDAPLALIVCSEAHRIVLYNRAAEALLGRSHPIGLDRKLSDVIDAEPIQAAFERLCAGASDGDMTEVMCTPLDEDTSICAKVYLVEERSSERMPRAYVLALEPVPKDHAATIPLAIANGHAAEPAHPAIITRASAATPIDFDFALLTNAATDAQERTDLDKLPFVVFDTETTGLRPDQGDEIVQIAAVRVVNGRVVADDRFDCLVNPESLIPAASIKIHGITPDMVDDADDISIVGKQFHRYVGDAILVAHNAPFDLAFLQKNRERIGHRFGNPVLDTILLSAVLFGRNEEHSLDALVARFGIEIPDHERHTALGDSIATAKALVQMLPMLADRGIVTLHDAFEACKPHRDMLASQPSGAKVDIEAVARV